MFRYIILLLFIGLVLCSPTNPNYNLPSDFPQITVSINNNPDSGHVFLNTVKIHQATGQATKNNYLIILNNLGEPLFFRKIDSFGAVDFKVQPSGLLSYIKTKPNYQKIAYIMNNHYTVIDSFTSENYAMDDHEFKLLENGHAILLAKTYRTVDLSQIIEGGSPSAQIEDYIIQEIDQNKNIVFEWNSADYFELTDAPHIDLTSQFIKYVHTNAVEIDTDGHFLLSSRHMDEITKIDRQTGDIIWRLGGINNEFTFLNDSLDFQHSIPTPFCYQHDIRKLENGNITLYDNGNYKDPNYTRMVEYQLDEINMTATLTWEYRDSSFNYSPWMGNVQRLPNNNTIGVWNMRDAPTTIIEVDQDCTKTFELSFEEFFNDNGTKLGIWNYRAYRFDWEGTADKPYLWSDTLNNLIELNFVQFGVNNVVQYYIYHGLSQYMMYKIDSTTNNFYRFSNLNHGEGETNFFQVSSLNFSDIESPLSNIISYNIDGLASVYKNLNSRSVVSLHQNYPNPFNPVTTLRFDLPEDALVNITIYDMMGRVVKTMVNSQQNAGYKSVQWNATNDNGAPVSAGLYLYTIEVGQYRQTKKMVLLK